MWPALVFMYKQYGLIYVMTLSCVLETLVYFISEFVVPKRKKNFLHEFFFFIASI
jgi:hypothetical protein